MFLYQFVCVCVRVHVHMAFSSLSFYVVVMLQYHLLVETVLTGFMPWE